MNVIIPRAARARPCAHCTLRALTTSHAAPRTTPRPHQQPPATTRTPHIRALTTTQPRRETPRPRKPRPLDNKDRGPPSDEDTQTDFAELDVLGRATTPTTSVDICLDDGFVLNSGLRLTDGDGVLLLGSEAFVWRPWMARPGAGAGGGIVTGTALRLAERGGRGTGGVVNGRGQLDVPAEAWGVLGALWPRPDLLIVGTGAGIRPLAPRSREVLQELGLRVEVLDTRNAASQFNMLAVERGTQEVAAALLPLGFGR